MKSDLYDRAGHGFSGHLPKGTDYSYASNLRDLRIVTQSQFHSYSLQSSLFLFVALGWNKEKYSFIGHSYGGQLSMAVKLFPLSNVTC